MAKAQRAGSNGNNGGNNGRKKRAVRPVQMEISAADLKHLAKAPGDYAAIAYKFADALELTRFRGKISAVQLRRMVARGQQLAQRAAAVQLKATTAERRRMLQDAEAWKGILSNWRLIQAAMPDRPELQGPFAFMQEYMSVTPRSTPQPPTPAAQ